MEKLPMEVSAPRFDSLNHHALRTSWSSIEELQMEVAIEIASCITTATADPMENLGSLWATCL
jgi:hypothetical protein